jgi:hypothetical protein
MATVTKTRVNFLCPSATVKIIERMAEADHRDKSSMMNKIVDFYLLYHAADGTPMLLLGDTKPHNSTNRKAGSR